MSERVPLSYLLAVAWTISCSVFLQALGTASVTLRPAAATDIVHLGGIEALVFVLGVLGVVALHGSDAPLRSALGIRPTSPVLLILAVLLGFALHFPAESIEVLVQRIHPTPKEEFASRIALLSAPSTPRLVLVLLVVACVGPLVEELFFRGAVYGSLRRRYSLGGAAAVTAVCFVIGHLDYYLWPSLTIVAAVMTLERAASGSLLPSLVTHVAFNAVSVLSLVAGPAPSLDPPKMDVVPALAGWGVTFVLVGLLRYVASRSPEARRGRAEDVE